MIKHLSRIFLLLSGTLLLAYYLPIGWHVLTAKRIRTPFIQYSDTGHGFIFTKVEFKNGDTHVVYSDREGRTYTRGQAEQMLPLTYYYQLYKNGTMPKEINGVKITSAAIQREMWNLRLRPDELDAPAVPLYTLFEAEGERARLEMPADYMRLRDDGRVEFLDPKTNKVLPEKSALYTETFARAKFAFPATLVGANPNPRKPYDEGIYLSDAGGQLYRLRRVKDTPELIRIADVAADPAAWNALRAQHIIVNEVETRELRCLIIDTNNQPWLAVGENFTLIKLPAETYAPSAATLTLRANLLGRLLTIQTPEKITAIALDRDYKILDRYEEELPTVAQQPASKLAKILFPFHWWLNDDSSSYYNFHGACGSLCALALNAAFLVIYIIIKLIRQRRNVAQTAKSASLLPGRSRLGSLRYALPELAVIAATGLCGFITALLLPRAE